MVSSRLTVSYQDSWNFAARTIPFVDALPLSKNRVMAWLESMCNERRCCIRGKERKKKKKGKKLSWTINPSTIPEPCY